MRSSCQNINNHKIHVSIQLIRKHEILNFYGEKEGGTDASSLEKLMGGG